MGDIRHAIPHLPEPDRTIAYTLVQFYKQMRELDMLANPNERAGKKAATIVMAVNGSRLYVSAEIELQMFNNK